ncbi:MAG: tyrosinase family protein [Acidobacteria bacterium]|nr:tyrosinase family protein [Acidobacteriota bacterium]
MNLEIQINNSTLPNARYVTWSPSPCRIRVTDPTGITGATVPVRLDRQGPATGGVIEFANTAGGPYSATLNLTLAKIGTSVNFFIRGVFGKPSSNDRDLQIRARASLAPPAFQNIASVPLMVRVRKNANKLSSAERDRVIAAFAQFNNQGMGRFADFRDMHVDAADFEEHHRAGFLPWHRAYLLDLERELQAIDPSVTIPYWRFDQPAPKIFKEDYLGKSDNNGTVSFSATNPLQFWTTDNVTGISRTPLFNTNSAPPNPMSENSTLALGADFASFRDMEGDPHGLAHTSFSGSIMSKQTAARDPLFFFLHCNVDRLWAKWQRTNSRFDIATPASFDPVNPGNKAGHNLPDTMWPWNGITNGGRPPFAPGGALAGSPFMSAPGPQPRVQDCFDYQGSVNLLNNLGFSYDDVR